MIQNQSQFSVLQAISSNRKTAVFFLILLTISMASLGIRLPWYTGILSGSGKPKPRPRAIIQGQSKTAKQVFNGISDSPAIVPENVVNIVSSEVLTIVSIFSTDQHLSVSHLDISSRAPPVTA
jgi:hypothetical protein